MLERFLGPSAYPHHGQRVVVGQRLMQAATDIFLGWQRIKGLDGVTRDYYVRQFHDWKGSADVDTMLRARGHPVRAHLRRDPRPARTPAGGTGSPSPPTSARETRSTARSRDFSAAYADQNERDYAAFAAAVASGRLVARTNVAAFDDRGARELSARGRAQGPVTRCFGCA